jgi:hypothetical protein
LAQTDAARERPKEGDLLVNVTAAAAPEPLKPDDLALDGKQTLAWPMDPETKTLRSGSRLNKVLLLRLRGVRRRDQGPRCRGSDRIFGNLSAHRVRRHQLASGSAVARMPLPLLDI